MQLYPQNFHTQATPRNLATPVNPFVRLLSHFCSRFAPCSQLTFGGTASAYARFPHPYGLTATYEARILNVKKRR
jgi:hypothetical protein